jgi:hypothetical protein
VLSGRLVDQLSPGDLHALRRVLQGDQAAINDLGSFGRLLVVSLNGSNPAEAFNAHVQTLPTLEQKTLLERLAATDTGAAAPLLRFRALGLTELRKRPRPSYVIDRLLQADTVAVLEGVDGTYKSFLALAWAHCIATGMPWRGCHVQQGRVLYLLGEGSRGLPKRADAWQIVNLGGCQDLDDELQFVVDEMPQLWQDDARDVIAANPGPYRYVVVDTLARAMVGANENQQQDMGQLIAGCDRLRIAYDGACVLLVHHLNVAGGTRGSSALPGGVHTRLRLTRELGSRTAVLTTAKQKEDEPETPLVLVARTVELPTVDDQGRPDTSLVLDPGAGAVLNPILNPTAEARLTRSSRSALDALARLKTASHAVWMRESRLVKSTFKHALDDLKRRGLVEQPDPGGAWRLTGSGFTWVQTGFIGPNEPSANGEGPGGSTRLTSVDPRTQCPDPVPDGPGGTLP